MRSGLLLCALTEVLAVESASMVRPVGRQFLVPEGTTSGAIAQESQALIEALGWSWVGDPTLPPPSNERWVILVTAAGCLSSVFVLRWKYTTNPIRYVCEATLMLAFCTFLFTGYLSTRVGPKYELVFLHCIGLEMLLGFDNVLDVVGWYTHADVSFNKKATYILSGAFIQMVIRVPVLPLLSQYVAGSSMWNQSTAVLLILLALRNLYLAFAAKSTEPGWSFFPAQWLSTTEISIPTRIFLAEFTAALCDVDAFIAKTLITKDAFAITASSVAVIGVLRAIALILLLYVHEDIFPMFVMWALSGSLMLTMAVHELWPSVPQIPPVIRMIIPVALYAYAVGVCIYMVNTQKSKQFDAVEESTPSAVVKKAHPVRARRGARNQLPNSVYVPDEE